MRSFSNDFYLNEDLIFGHIGHFLVLLALASSLFSFVSGIMYYFNNTKYSELKKTAQQLFYIHAFSIFGILLLLIYMFKTQQYEYHYIWRHSSTELPWYYILSAMWEGQEGSFLLWMFWHAVLGLFLMRKISDLRIGSLAILALIQTMLCSMILGIEIGDYAIGSSPFILLRNELSIPILERANYLEFIKDGNGLNILLQNYWMVIHPPVLFLGFASVSVPFAYAFASLMKRDFESWIKEVSPWALFSVAMLGCGILMGGKWAYEALSFGGFWAWDPVENASFVPWLFLIAAVHTTMIYNATKHSLKASYLFYVLAFAFVLYSTFLTRSGILGDSSVHSFTDLGMTGHLLVFIGLFLLPSFLILAFYWSRLPEKKEEENTSSREFWIFIGMLIVIVSALQITFSTSIPVWNKVFGTKMAPPVNANAHYNSIQIWFAIFTLLLMGLSPILKYLKTDFKLLKKPFWISIVASVVLSAILVYFSEIPFFQKYKIGTKDSFVTVQFLSSYFLLYVSCVWSLYMSVWFVVKNNLIKNYKTWGGMIAHVGFVLLVLGSLLSQYQKKAISFNMSGVDFGKEFDDEEQSSNTLLIKNKKELMPPYEVTYKNSIPTKKGAIYHVFFQNSKSPSDTFSLYPEAMFIKEGENTRLNAEPSIAHYFGKDVFTHVSSVPDTDAANNKEKKKSARPGDTLFSTKNAIYFEKVVASPSKNGEIQVTATLHILEQGKQKEILSPVYSLDTKTGGFNNPTFSSKDEELKVKISEINPDKEEFNFAIEEKNPISDWIIMKAIVFPQINILWLGCILLVLGSLMSAYYKKIAK
jgi:cytochrome c-type biogenesis protein CcmF